VRGLITTGLLIAWAAQALAAESPWDYATLSKTPHYSWEMSSGPLRSLVYEGEEFRGEATEVYAFYASPATLAPENPPPGPYPAIVLVHGGWGTAYHHWVKLWARRGYAAIAMDLNGSRPDLRPQERVGLKAFARRLPNGGPPMDDYRTFGVVAEGQPKDSHWLYHAVANVTRAHSLLRDLEEVDSDRTAIMGISWGGFVTLLATSLDARYSAAVNVYGSGLLHEGSAWSEKLSGYDTADRNHWQQLYEPAGYVAKARVPMLFMSGTKDPFYHLDSLSRTYTLYGGAKKLRLLPDMPHSHAHAWTPQESYQFIDSHLRGAVPLPHIGTPILDPKRLHVHAPVRGVGETAQADLYFATGAGAAPKQAWNSIRGRIYNGEVHASAPPGNASAWLIVMQDGDVRISSEVVYTHKPQQITSRPE
jgi:dienelactone hydrolase